MNKIEGANNIPFLHASVGRRDEVYAGESDGNIVRRTPVRTTRKRVALSEGAFHRLPNALRLERYSFTKIHSCECTTVISCKQFGQNMGQTSTLVGDRMTVPFENVRYH